MRQRDRKKRDHEKSQQIKFLIKKYFYLPKRNSVGFLPAIWFTGKDFSNKWSESGSPRNMVKTPNSKSLEREREKKGKNKSSDIKLK